MLLLAFVTAIPAENTRDNLLEAEGFITQGMDWKRKGETQRAIHKFDEAIRLDPQNASASCNRVIVHTRLGIDREAQMNASRAAGLGFDPSLIESDINSEKAER